MITSFLMRSSTICFAFHVAMECNALIDLPLEKQGRPQVKDNQT